MKTLSSLVLLVGLVGPGQSAPAGWTLVKDRNQLCQATVPADWTANRIMPSNLTSPDKKASVTFGSKPSSVSYVDIVKSAKSIMKPVKTIEDTATRTWFVAETKPGRNATSWYVALNTNPVCEAQVEFEDAAFEAKAKQIVNSLKMVK